MTVIIYIINDLPQRVSLSQCLLFADDLKLSLGVETSADCEALQRDIDAVGDWSSENRLPFNIEKCKTISFSRKRQLINAAYTLSDAALQRVSDIRDLGLQLDSRLNFHDHVTAFVMRTSSEFNNLGVATVLYNAYIRSKLEYGGIVWAPSEEKYNIMLERVLSLLIPFLFCSWYGGSGDPQVQEGGANNIALSVNSAP
ncbi:hypothetical protein HF086_008232 [Spodoptera exigua]|uniref:Reverse transcriptase domain-containing protein n=1 Tax=Spodoptera exigua TaxID=7107 RepID=A0A922MHL6_SPOEX|nr:hypothetical protein HF086_008232 [Spodoptera exigua]